MRRFLLVRHEDPGGLSGTGVVIEGCEWSDGTVSIRWIGTHKSFANWESIQVFIEVHGHEGASTVEWIDPPEYWLLEIARFSGEETQTIHVGVTAALEFLRLVLREARGSEVEDLEEEALLGYAGDIGWRVNLTAVEEWRYMT